MRQREQPHWPTPQRAPWAHSATRDCPCRRAHLRPTSHIASLAHPLHNCVCARAPAGAIGGDAITGGKTAPAAAAAPKYVQMYAIIMTHISKIPRTVRLVIIAQSSAPAHRHLLARLGAHQRPPDPQLRTSPLHAHVGRVSRVSRAHGGAPPMTASKCLCLALNATMTVRSDGSGASSPHTLSRETIRVLTCDTSFNMRTRHRVAHPSHLVYMRSNVHEARALIRELLASHGGGRFAG